SQCASPRPPAAERQGGSCDGGTDAVSREIGGVGVAGRNRALAELGRGAVGETESDRQPERAASAEARLGGAGDEEGLDEEEGGVGKLVEAELEGWQPAVGERGNGETVEGEEPPDDEGPRER